MRQLLKWLKLIVSLPGVFFGWLFEDHPVKFFGGIFVLIIASIIWAVGASREHALANPPPGVEILVRPTGEWTGLYRFRDADAGVTCYSAREGMSCVRDSP